MGIEFRCICKDCQIEFGYSEASIQAGVTRGLSRPERCPACRRIHSKEGQAIGIPQIPLRPIGRRKPDSDLEPGRLGKIFHPDRPHRQIQIEGKFGKPDSLIDFGITDDDIRALFNTMREYQVVVVVGPTGSGKSTLLPYRLMVPPDGIEPDLFTRYGQIAITQPRTQATRSIAAFVARDLHGSSLGAGFDVGFRHRDAPMSDWRNKLVYLTDGTLINWIVSGQLDKLSVIMIDEAHERSLNIDLILGLLKQQLPRYPLLKLIIASATINAELFQNYYGGPDKTALITFRGLKQYSVEAYFPFGDAHLAISRDVPQKMADKVHELLLSIAKGHKEEGDILGFLPGAKEIENCIERLDAAIQETEELRRRGIGAYPLYSTLPQEALDRALAKKTHVVRDRIIQHIERAVSSAGEDRLLVLLLDLKSASEAKNLVDQALETRGIGTWHTLLVAHDATTIDSIPNQIVFATHELAKTMSGLTGYKIITDRRVIISTNVAETSLTVDGIVYVVDSGLIKESRWDPVNGASELPTHFHSRAGCRQRWGRAGRVRDGEAHMLYTDTQFEDPEIFRPHTLPEIQRSCLEKIVLTAKAAGINDIQHFDWIEKPPAVELERAPAILKMSGALDEEGDLTGLGMELQSFMTDIPVAGLLVAADRFACGVEMATLAALLQVQFRSLLRWDRRWDFATRAKVGSIHESLASSCQDDLEFYFKVYSICTETASSSQRAKLCQLFFIDHETFTAKVQDSRRLFLEMLAIGKKSEEDRTISFSSLNKFRFILSVTLPERYFFRQEDGAITCLDPSTEMAVDIDQDSINSVRLSPFFLALGRRVVMRGDQKRLSLSCLIRVEEDWLAMRNKAVPELAIYAARHLFRETEVAPVSSTRARILADVYYPLGSVWSMEQAVDAASVLPNRLIQLPEPFFPVVNEEKLDKEEDATQVDIGDIDPLAGSDDTENRLIAAGEEDEGLLPVLEYEDDDIASGFIVLPEARLGPRQCSFQVEAGMEGPCIVIGHTTDHFSKPIVLLQSWQEGKEQTGKNFFVVGQRYSVRGEELLTLGGKETALSVSLVGCPGQRHIVSAGDLSFSGRYLIPERLVGKTFELVAVARQGGAVLTRLPLVEEKLHAYLAPGKSIPCTLVELEEYKGFVLLEEFSRESGIDEIAFGYLRPNPKEKNPQVYQLGKEYSLFLQGDYGLAQESLYLPTEKLLEWIEAHKHEHGIFYNPRQQRLHTTKPLTSVVRAELAALKPDPEFATVLARLYRHSNKVKVREKSGGRALDLSKSVVLEQYRHAEIPEYQAGELVRGRISEIWGNGVAVVLDRGGVGKIYMNHLAWEAFGFIDPRELVTPGQEIEARVLGMKVEPPNKEGEQAKIKISLSLLKEETFPSALRERYKKGSVHSGRITWIDDDKKMILAEFETKVVGKIPAHEISHDRVVRVSDHLHLGQEVQVKVLELSISPLERLNPLRLTLSCKALLPPPAKDLRKYQKDSVHPARIIRIIDEKGFAIAELEQGVTAIIRAEEVAWEKRKNISEYLKVGETRQLRIIEADPRGKRFALSVKSAIRKELHIDVGVVKRIVGLGGQTVKEIRRESLCWIDCDFETGAVVLSGPTAEAITIAEGLIQKSIHHSFPQPKEQRKEAETSIPPYAQKHVVVSTVILVPQNRIGTLKGKQAATIRRLKEESKCGIWYNENGETSIRGKRRHDVQQAVDLIKKLIPEATWDGTILEQSR
jgi:HrpA-like RNA helicase/predicted RNA-binding protein with RPS1 domain